MAKNGLLNRLQERLLRQGAANLSGPRWAVPTMASMPVPLSVGIHPVTCSLGVPTRHLDVRYLLRAPVGAVPVISDARTVQPSRT